MIKARHIYKIFLLVTLILFSCEKQHLKGQKFIEHNFLAIIDTATGTSGKILKQSEGLKASIHLEPNISYNENTDELLLTFFYNNPSCKEQFKDLLYTVTYDEFSIDSTFARKIGGYWVNLGSSKSSTRNTERIAIENFKSFNNQAMLVLKSAKGKSAVFSILLFRKIKGKWKIVKREVLAQV